MLKENIICLFPEIVMFIGSIILLMIGVFSKNKNSSQVINILAGAILLFVLMILVISFVDGANYHLYNQLMVNRFTHLLKIMLIIATIVIIYMSSADKLYLKRPFEFYIIILLSLTGMMIMLTADNFLILYMGIEIQSLPLYILVALSRNQVMSSESSLKYFIMGSLASGLLLYGIALIYGGSGTIGYSNFLHVIQHSVTVPSTIIVGIVLVLVAILFKLSAVPFHMWTPDVYQGAPTIVTSFLAIVPKIAMVGLLLKLSSTILLDLHYILEQIFFVVAILSMFVGTLAAYRQTDLKRLIAYSSIAHMGFMLVGIVAGGSLGIQATLLYLMLYIFMSLGFFACILSLRKKGNSINKISDLSGLSKMHPKIACCLSIFLFSMAGIPPMAGFFAKFIIFKAAINYNYIILAVVGLIASVFAAYYYIRIIKVMYVDSVIQKLDTDINCKLKSVIYVAAIINLFYCINPDMLITIISFASGTNI